MIVFASRSKAAALSPMVPATSIPLDELLHVAIAHEHVDVAIGKNGDADSVAVVAADDVDFGGDVFGRHLEIVRRRRRGNGGSGERRAATIFFHVFFSLYGLQCESERRRWNFL